MMTPENEQRLRDAAPDLLAALKAALPILEEDCADMEGRTQPEVLAAHCLIRDAIAKAEETKC